MRFSQKPTIGRRSPRPTLVAASAATMAVGMALFGLTSAAQADSDVPPAEESLVVEQVETADESQATDAAADAAPAVEQAAAPVEDVAPAEPVAEQPAVEESVIEAEAEDVASDPSAEADSAAADIAAADAPMTLAADDSLVMTPLFVVDVSLVDESGDWVRTPAEFDWTITATGPVTYVSENLGSSTIFVEAPAPGSYTLDLELNAAAAAQLTFDEVVCSYTDGLATFDPDWLHVEYRNGARWAVDVPTVLTTACVFYYEVAGALPDPHFELWDVFVYGATGDGSEQLHVGDSSDFVAVLRSADGSVVRSVAPGGDVQVPPGTYTRTVEASPSSQPGFDIDDWIIDGWNCGGTAGSDRNSSVIELVAGQTVNCSISATDARADLWTTVDHSGEVTMDWDGALGATGTQFDTIVTVSNSLGLFSAPPVEDLTVAVRLGDNTELIDPASAPAGWALVSIDGDTYTYEYLSPLALEAEATLVLPTRLTAPRATRAIEVCAFTDVIQENSRNDCAKLHAVADGAPHPGTEPTPEPGTDPGTDPTPDPEPTPDLEPEPALEPEPKPSTSPNPATTTVPAPAASTTPAPVAANNDDKGGLAKTGADSSGTIALGISLLLAGALAVGARRKRRA